MGKYIVGYCKEFQKMYFTKDVFVIPFYISKLLNLNIKYFYEINIGKDAIPVEYRGTRIKGFGHSKVNDRTVFVDLVRTILFHAKSIKVCFFVHLSHPVMLITILYKILNPQGKVMVMGDMDNTCATRLVEHGFVFSTGIKGKIKKMLVNAFFRKVDVFSVGEEIVYLTLSGMFNKNKWKGLTICHPCLDDDLFYSLGLQQPTESAKENMMITVGRIGSYQKNTDMMLEAFTKVDFKDWKVILIGPFTDGFSTKKTSNYVQKIEQFFEKNPHLRKHIVFTGPMYDVKQIYDYYIRSKVFLLTSRFEGFANVVSDAAALGCYIVSTDVGGASCVSNNWKFGTKLNQEDSNQLASVLAAIIDGNLQMDVTQQKPFHDLLWSNMIQKNVLPKLM